MDTVLLLEEDELANLSDNVFYMTCIIKNTYLQLKRRRNKGRNKGRKREIATLSSKAKFLNFGKTACSCNI